MITKDFIVPGKANMVIDGQFGSTGKGLICGRIAMDNHIDIVCSRLAPNAGHTFYYKDKKYVTKLIPVAGIINDRSTIYLGYNSVIDLDILFREIEEFDIDPNRLCIHSRASVITKEMKELEKENLTKISSTLSGTGYARSSKILRQANLAKDIPELKDFIHDLKLDYFLKTKCSIFIETGQGYDLSLNVGYSYPYCTSTDIIPSAVLADFNIHPEYMGNCMMSLRLYPIRVGNVIDTYGTQIGYSGPIPADSTEISWSDLEVSPETTTVTGKVRRVFTFSKERYEQALEDIKPSHVFLNFINYVRESDLDIFDNVRKPDLVGYGPYPEQIRIYDKDSLDNYLNKFK